MGMVNEPDPTTFATDEPEIVPCRAEEITATLAGPPDAHPAMALAISIKNFPSPVFQDTPQKDKKEIKVDDTPMGIPKTPSVV